MILCREASDLLGASAVLLGRLDVLQHRLGLPLAEGKVEICENDVPGLVQQDVLWLQVTVDETHQVEVLKSNQYLQHNTLIA
jgi:hypothetical protein